VSVSSLAGLRRAKVPAAGINRVIFVFLRRPSRLATFFQFIAAAPLSRPYCSSFLLGSGCIEYQGNSKC